MYKILLFLSLVSVVASDRLHKTFDFSSRNSVLREWDVLNWQPGVVNNELQAYTDSHHHVYTAERILHIKAKKPSNGNGFLSGRLQSKERFSPLNFHTQKMRVAFTAKVPAYEGAWPALWMHGKQETYGGWPKTGEIDVMEYVHSLGTKTLSALHWKGASDYSQSHDVYPNGHNQIRYELHTYRVDVSAIPGNEYIQFSVDNHWYEWLRPSLWESSYEQGGAPCHQPTHNRCTKLKPFDNQMALIMNVAVGGNWGSVGVHNYDAFNGDGIIMEVHNVSVWELSP